MPACGRDELPFSNFPAVQRYHNSNKIPQHSTVMLGYNKPPPAVAVPATNTYLDIFFFQMSHFLFFSQSFEQTNRGSLGNIDGARFLQ